MTTPELPTLPVLLPLTVIAIAAVAGHLHRRGRLTALRLVTVVALCSYAAIIAGHVLFPYPIDLHDPRPWRVWLHLTPLVDALDDPIGIVLNTALFVPLGALLPFAFRIRSVRHAALCGLLVSLGIESLQLLGDLTVSPGRVADVDDLIGNTLGAVLGYLLFLVAAFVPGVTRLARVTRVPAPRRDSVPDSGTEPRQIRT